MRILLSVLLLAPPGILHGHDVPARAERLAPPRRVAAVLLERQRHHLDVRSVLGMALSIEFGIAKTYEIGVAFYVVCAIMIVVSRRAGRLSEDDITSEAMAVAPSIQPTLAELVAGIPAGKALEIDRAAFTTLMTGWRL